MEWEYCTYTTDHARGGSAHLKVILANLCTVEHGVERSDFVHLHGSHLEDLGDFVHGSESKEVIVLLLSDKQDGNAATRLVVVWVLSEKSFNCCI